MTIEEMMLFKGNAEQMVEYQKLLNRKDRLKKQIRTLSNKIHDEDDSLSVFDGELNEKDMQIFKNHVAKRNELVKERNIKQGTFELVMKKIFEMQS